jgi:hypothetical protein
MSPEDLNQIKRFCSPQDQIQWGILFLSRHLRNLSPWDREECLQDEWEWARQQGDLLRLQILRDYRECWKESGPTYRRHQDWFLSNWNNPEFWVELEKRFPRSGMRGRRRASAPNCIKRGTGTVHLTDALTLFKRLGLDVPSLSAREFSLAYYRLAKRYHPDQGNDAGHDLMANINAARTTILKAYRHRN